MLDTMDNISSHLDVVVGEFTDFDLVHTHDLFLLRSTELETWDQVDHKEDDAAENKGVRHTSDTVTQLVGELDVVVVDPATFDHGSTVKSCNVVGSEQTGEEISDKTTNTVDGEDIEGIINVEKELEFGAIVACDGSDHTEDDGSPSWDETTAGGDGDQTGNDTTAEANSRPLAFQAIIENTPGETTDTSSKVGDNGSHHSAKVSG